MPKLKQTPEQRQMTLVAANLRYYATLADTTPERMAAAAHVCKSTMYKRLHNPEDMTLRELVRLAAALHVKPADLLEGKSA